MREYFKHDPWKVIEEGFDPHMNKVAESIFSIGNGRMGQRANFEEQYSGETLPGSYVAGVYYPDKTRVGWWKNGYPEYFAKVLNAPNWINLHISIEGQPLDLAKCKVESFKRELDMKVGILTRQFVAILPDGKKVEVKASRFCSMADDEIGAIKFSLKPINFSGAMTVVSGIDADVVNMDSNYDEKFWNEVYKDASNGQAVVTAETKKTFFHVCCGSTIAVEQNGSEVTLKQSPIMKDKYAAFQFDLSIGSGEETIIYKYAAVLSSENHKKEDLVAKCRTQLDYARQQGYEKLRAAHIKIWDDKWNECDITIEGDVGAQQGIRFNIFQLNQTYTGKDERLNIGPKGFTGEKYGGSTYWDTEAYCLPFYLGTADQKVARNLLVYRYKHLQRAIENAGKLGFTKGAALYPMVTMNGEECHNEWEITFEEIHRNGAIAYAIFDYIRYTGDQDYLIEYGLEVLIGISRFWAQRVNWSDDKSKYVMLGVTGPNEYENNVNNNWYTNLIARWTLSYTLESIEYVKREDESRFGKLVQSINFDEPEEKKKWKDIIDKMYFPEDKHRGIFLQQDGFLDKVIKPVSQLAKGDRPLNQKWSWDRILRSCYIKQADVLQGLYFFEEEFDKDAIKRNFDFYEPITVHESSLSPCVHSILAALLGYRDKAYEMYLRTARLDLDDYNNDTEDGCHITSMAGTWLSITKGFGGFRVAGDQVHLHPFIPGQWQSYSFKLEFRGHVIKVNVTQSSIDVTLEEGKELGIVIYGQHFLLKDKVTTPIQ